VVSEGSEVYSGGEEIVGIRRGNGVGPSTRRVVRRNQSVAGKRSDVRARDVKINAGTKIERVLMHDEVDHRREGLSIAGLSLNRGGREQQTSKITLVDRRVCRAPFQEINE